MQLPQLEIDMNNVVYLHGQPTPIARFLRVSEHRRLEHLLESDRLSYDRFVIEAGAFKEQQDLIIALRQKGHELVLDTNVAELSAIAKYAGRARNAPWANPDGILTKAHLKAEPGKKVIAAIAQFAVQHGFSRVQAPTHFVADSRDAWWPIDLENCVALRRALDTEGGKDVAIDYSLMIPNRVLNETSERRALVSPLNGLPIDSIWLRISGFGAAGTAAGTRKYIAAAQEFHMIGKPIVADGVGGHAGLAIVAFGAACGLSYGVAGRERFDASDWQRPSKLRGGGGSQYSVLLPGIDVLLRREDAEAIMSVPSGRRLGACIDPRCCPLGFDDTIKDPKGHFLRQRAYRCDDLSAVSDLMRPRHYLDKILTDDWRRAKLLAKLKLSDAKLRARLVENANRLDRFSESLDGLEQMGAKTTRSAGIEQSQPPGAPRKIVANHG
jgi:hypothetical protein